MSSTGDFFAFAGAAGVAAEAVEVGAAVAFAGAAGIVEAVEVAAFAGAVFTGAAVEVAAAEAVFAEAVPTEDALSTACLQAVSATSYRFSPKSHMSIVFSRNCGLIASMLTMVNSKKWVTRLQVEKVNAEVSAGAASDVSAGRLAARRLDPRVSVLILVLLNATAFAPTLLAAEFLMVALAALVVVWCGRPASAVRWCVAYALITAAGYLFLIFPNAITASFATMLVMVRRVFIVGMFASNMIATTRAGELACALQRVRLPRHAIVALCVALRFFPTMAGEFRAVHEAMRVRGMALTPVYVLRHPVRVMENMLVPVMSRLSIVADELSNAALVRGMDSNCVRTSYYDLRLRPADVLFLAAFAANASLFLLAKAQVLP